MRFVEPETELNFVFNVSFAVDQNKILDRQDKNTYINICPVLCPGVL